MAVDQSTKRRSGEFLVKLRKFLFGGRKRFIATTIVVILLGFFAWRTYGQGSTQPQYQTTTVTKGTIIQTVTGNGNVASGSQAGVGSPTKGIVTEIYVKNGDTVTKGQKLFKVQSIALEQEVASAWAGYLNTSSAYNTAVSNKTANQSKLEQDRKAVIDASSAVTTMQNNLNTSKNNPATGQPYSQNEIDAIHSTLTSARQTFSADEQKYTQTDQAIAAAAASKNSSWLEYEATQDSDVAAPIDGTVANITVKTGDQVNASSGNLSSNQNNNSSSSTTSSPVLSIGNYTSPYIKVTASEVDVPKIKAGQKANITLDAFSGKSYVGIVDQVDTTGAISSGVVSFNVFVSFVVPPDDLRPGMSANVSIVTARKDDILYVPSSAVQKSNGETTVRVLQNEQVTSVPVETGLTSDSDTEIISGLNEGETIVTAVISRQSTSSGSSPFGGGIRGIGGGLGGGGNVRIQGGR